METKVCSNCAEEKPIIKFGVRKDTGNIFGRCRDCRNKSNKKYYHAVGYVRKSQYCKENRSKIRDKYKEIRDAYYVINRHHIKERKAKYYKEKKKHIDERNKKWRNENPGQHGKNQRSDMNALADKYIIQRLSIDGVEYGNITDDMIRIKRKLIVERSKNKIVYVNVLTGDEFKRVEDIPLNISSSSIGLKFRGKTVNDTDYIRVKRLEDKSIKIWEHLIFLESIKK